MGRKLPTYDPKVDGPWDTSKRRLQVFKRIYQNYYLWQSLREAGEVEDVLTIEGEDYYISDLLVGYDTLPEQQQRAFKLICLEGYTESAATAEILPHSRWSTPVQQYSDDGLKKMVAAYDAKQAGTWDPTAVKKRRRVSRKKEPVSTDAQSAQSQVAKDKGPTPKWDWTSWSEDHQALADYINKETDLGITPAQVKAVAYLRKKWYHGSDHQAALQARKQEREQAKAKFAYETPEQRKARHDAARALKSAENATKRAQQEMERVKELRTAAGLDPETGEPVASSA